MSGNSLTTDQWAARNDKDKYQINHREEEEEVEVPRSCFSFPSSNLNMARKNMARNGETRRACSIDSLRQRVSSVLLSTLHGGGRGGGGRRGELIKPGQDTHNWIKCLHNESPEGRDIVVWWGKGVEVPKRHLYDSGLHHSLRRSGVATGT